MICLTAGQYTAVVDDPETLRARKNMETISNIAYHGDMVKKVEMENARPGEVESGRSCFPLPGGDGGGREMEEEGREREREKELVRVENHICVKEVEREGEGWREREGEEGEE